MFLNDREVKILEKLYHEQEIELDKLSEEFEISTRMIRYNIEKINTALLFFNMPILKRVKKSTFRFVKYVDKNKLMELVKEVKPLEKKNRQYLIELMLLINKEVLNITKLSKYFDVTRITINSDIKDIKKKLSSKGISLISEDGVKIGLNKTSYKKYKIEILSRALIYIDSKESYFIKKIKDIVFSNIDYEKYLDIKNMTLEMIEILKIKINEKQKYNTIVRMLTLFIENYHYFEQIDIDKNQIINSKEYKIIHNIVLKYDFKEFYNMDKIISITNLFLWIKAYEDYEKYHRNLMNIELFSKNMINQVEKKIGIKISKDELLLEFLIQHLKSLVYRLKNGYDLTQESINLELKEKDDLFYKIKESVSTLENVFKEDINDEEIYLLRIHFLASIERLKKQNLESSKVVVITDLGYGSQKILTNSLRSRFLIEVLYIGPLHKMPKDFILKSGVEYILTTIKLDKFDFNNKKYIKISPILTEEEVQILKSKGLKTNNKKIILSDLMKVIEENSVIKNKEKLIAELLKTFSLRISNDLYEDEEEFQILKKDNIVYLDEEISDENAIKVGLDLLKDEYVTDSYIENVMWIYRNNLKYIIRHNGIIIPHAKNKNNIKKSGISIVKLKNPILVNGTEEKIDVIVTFAIKNELKIQDIIGNALSKIFKDEFRLLLDKKDKKEIISYLKN